MESTFGHIRINYSFCERGKKDLGLEEEEGKKEKKSRC